MFSRAAKSCLLRAHYQKKILVVSLSRQQQCAGLAISAEKRGKSLIPKREEFASRHIGPRESDRDQMLAYLGYKVRFQFAFYKENKAFAKTVSIRFIDTG